MQARCKVRFIFAITSSWIEPRLACRRLTDNIAALSVVYQLTSSHGTFLAISYVSNKRLAVTYVNSVEADWRRYRDDDFLNLYSGGTAVLRQLLDGIPLTGESAHI